MTTDDLGVRHSLTPITDADRIAEIRRVVGSAPLVLADGHHRFETAIAYRNERTEAGAATDADGMVMCLVVELAEEQLWVQPIHRLLTGVADPAALRAALRPGSTSTTSARAPRNGSPSSSWRCASRVASVSSTRRASPRLIPHPDAA